MHRRATIAIVAAALALGACTTSSPGHGTGAGGASPPASSPSQPLSASPPGSSSASSSASSASSTAPPPSSAAPTSSSATLSGGSTYTGRGNPNTWCGSSQLAVTAVSAGGAAGHTGVVLRFLNNSHYRCIIYGYPGVDGTNRGGHSIASAARTPDGFLGGCRCTSLRGVLVQPGQTASALVEGDLGGGNCDRFHGLLVTPPNTYNSTPLHLAPESCHFQVHPVVPGSDGRG